MRFTLLLTSLLVSANSNPTVYNRFEGTSNIYQMPPFQTLYKSSDTSGQTTCHRDPLARETGSGHWPQHVEEHVASCTLHLRLQ